ncbi:HAD-like domain-containing protein [Phlyctochytrium arcticum]|nr:HAD-like domain-containing protein [Phlyctochytrium arcticum]
MTTPESHPPVTDLPPFFNAESIKAVACDMDGTVLLPSHTPSQRTITTFAALRVARPDIHILFATGRPRSAARNAAPLMTAGGAVAVYLNGALAGAELPDNTFEVIHELPLAPVDAGWYLRFAAQRGLTMVVYSGNDMLTTTERDVVFKTSVDAGEPKTLLQRDSAAFLASIEDGSVTAHKCAFLSMDFPMLDALNHELSHMSSGRPADTSILVRTGPERLEIMHVGATKAAALSALCKSGKLGEQVSLSHVIAFGDGENDVEMLAEAGMGVAMGNGVANAKKVAKYTCPGNEVDGVARVLEGIFGL